MRPDKILVLQDKQYENTEMPLTNINSFWLQGIGYDITIGEDVRGDPYIIIGINRIGTHMKLQEIDNSWRGKIIKIVGTGSSIERKCARAQTHIQRKTDLEDLACAR